MRDAIVALMKAPKVISIHFLLLHCFSLIQTKFFVYLFIPFIYLFLKKKLPATPLAAHGSGADILELDESDARDSNSLPLQLPIALDDGPRGVVIYNPLPRWRKQVISIPVEYADARVIDSDGNELDKQQLQPNWAEVVDTVAGHYRLFFLAEVPPLGYVTYFVERDRPGAKERIAKVSAVETSSTIREVFVFLGLIILFVSNMANIV